MNIDILSIGFPPYRPTKIAKKKGEEFKKLPAFFDPTSK
jgi:hypothetical protein